MTEWNPTNATGKDTEGHEPYLLFPGVSEESAIQEYFIGRNGCRSAAWSWKAQSVHSGQRWREQLTTGQTEREA